MLKDNVLSESAGEGSCEGQLGEKGPLSWMPERE